MEWYNICPHHFQQKIGFITNKNNYTNVYLNIADELDQRDLIYNYDYENALKNSFKIDPD